jgi:hypothetical protein
MDTLKDGTYWLGKLEGALPAVVKYMALHRYGAAPDVDDRVSDALAALVEGSTRFQPQPGKDGVGYYLQYVLSDVAGALSWTLSKGHPSGIPGHNRSSAWIVKSRPRMGDLLYKRDEITVEPHSTGHR